MLNWANRFNILCFLDSNNYPEKYPSFEWLLGAGCAEFYSPPEKILDSLDRFSSQHEDWLFGHFNYDLKNEIEQVSSGHTDHINFPEAFLFRPLIVISKKDDIVTIESLNESTSAIFKAISESKYDAGYIPLKNINIQSRISRNDYIKIIQKLQQHILHGDCYEINFCMEFFAENTIIDTLNVYRQLNKISPNPFSCYYKLNDKYLLCASPERYLKKKGRYIISQPVKGTIQRDNVNVRIDIQNKEQLFKSSKNRSENVMIVDLMRNDLSRICKENSVYVEELFGIYSFPQVHQMISTVKGELKENTGIADILKAAFPMGSMTGAPKKRVMQLIEQYERTKRGIFSGTVGYITPEKDFDFNVVIRSIMYNATNRYLSYQAGSGITFYSDAEEEYEECLLKAKAIEQVLV